MGEAVNIDDAAGAAARRREWFRYYSAKRIGHQWFQVHLLQGLPVQRVLEVGPNLGLVTAMLANAGYEVTTLDLWPQQFAHPRVPHIQAELGTVAPDRMAGFDAILCCETLEHLPWGRLLALLHGFREAAPRYMVISVPYKGFQLDWRLYCNHLTWRHTLSLKAMRFLRPFRFDSAADPYGHKWEVGYRGVSLKALERVIGESGWQVRRRDFTSPTRSVFYVLQPS